MILYKKQEMKKYENKDVLFVVVVFFELDG